MQNIIDSFTSSDIVEIAYADDNDIVHDRWGYLISSTGEVSHINRAGVMFVGGYQNYRPFSYVNRGRMAFQDRVMKMAIRKVGTYEGYDREIFEIPGEWIFA